MLMPGPDYHQNPFVGRPFVERTDSDGDRRAALLDGAVEAQRRTCCSWRPARSAIRRSDSPSPHASHTTTCSGADNDDPTPIPASTTTDHPPVVR